MNNTIAKTNQILFLVVLLGFILYVGKPLLMPLSFSLLIACILYPINRWLEVRGVHRIAAITLSISFILVFFIGLIFLLVRLFTSFVVKWPLLKAKLTILLDGINQYLINELKISSDQQKTWFDNIFDKLPQTVIPFLQNILYQSSIGLVLLIMIPVFTGLILYYRKLLVQALYSVFPAIRQETLLEIIMETIHTYYNFIRGMLLVYFIVGILNSLGLLILGIPDPFVYGFLVAIMTFIPYVGILIAASLPITVAWITFESPWYPMAVVLLFTFVQYLEANVIFPFAVSSRLKMNAMVTLSMILLGGLIWGGAGMILFIPYAAIVKLIADHVKEKNVISILFGEGTS